MLYSIVIPCYNSSHTISDVVDLIKEEMPKCNITDYELILVNDCSPDGGKTLSVLKQLAKENECIKVINLAKNAGQHNAIMAGLNYADGDIIIGMDDDMQTHPSQISILLSELDKGYDIVYGYYPEKKESGFRRFGSYINHLSVRILIGKPKELKTSSFWVIRRFVRDSVIEYKGSFAYMQGLFLRTTNNIASVPIKHYERAYGKSNYTFKKLLKLWSSIIGFSIVPLKLAQWCGMLFSCVGIIGAIVIFIRKLINPAMAVGWPSMMIAICFFAGINLMFLGLIGEYVGRIFLGQNNQPQYVIKEVIKKEE